MKMRCFFTCLFILLLIFKLPLHPSEQEEEEIVVDSKIADYDGNTIILQGEVHVEHDLGTICANYVEMAREETGSDQMQFKGLALKDKVEIALKEGGHLSCSSANIDFHALEGHFFGGSLQEFVVYSENGQNRIGSTVPFSVKSHAMTVYLGEKQPSKEGKKK